MRNRRMNIILALIAACALWVYVVGEMDPSTTRVYRDVNIRYTNVQTLEEQGLAVSSYEDTTISITLEGKRSVLQKLSSTDINVIVDLTNANEGTNRLKVSVDAPTGTTVSRQSVTFVNVEVEPLVSEERTVEISFAGDYTQEEEPTVLSQSIENVTISGAKSLVDQVTTVYGEISRESLGDDETDLPVTLSAVDANGNTVENITLSNTNCNVKAVIYQKKTVALDLSVTGLDDDSDLSYTAPTEVTVKGSHANLENITSISTETIDLSEITEETSLEITPILPEGIYLSTPEDDLMLQVIKNSSQTVKTIEMDTSEIQVTGLAEDLSFAVEQETIAITVSGSETDVNAITGSDLVLRLDAETWGVGTLSVTPSVSISNGNSNLSFSAEQINVIVMQAEE